MSSALPRWSTPPRVPSHFVPKPDVYDVLDAGSAVTVLRAPQGYGKSAHVGEWLRRTGQDAVWMTAHPTEDADDFWGSLLQLLLQAGVTDHDEDGLAGSTPDVPWAPDGPPDPQQVVREALTRTSTPFVLVVDHLEQVRTTRVDAVLARMVAASPGVRLVLCSHPSNDREHLAHLGMDCAFVEGQALALTPAEITRLAISLDAVVADGVVRSLHHDLWGWPGPTRGLLTASLGSGEIPRTDWRTLGSLFGDRSLTSSDATGFIMRTVVLDEFTAGLAQEVSGVEQATEVLGTLEASGLVRSRPSPEGRLYTYMPLLRSLSTTSEWTHVSSLVTDAHRRAAEVLASTPERALHHATAAQDWDQVVEIADSGWVELVIGAPAVLAEALAQLPGRYFQSMPRLVTARDVLLESRNDTITALSVPWPDPHEVVEVSALRDVVGVAVGQIVAERRAYRYDTAGDTAHRLVTALRDHEGRYRPGTEDVLPFLLLHAGVAQLSAGSIDAATDDLLACTWAGTGSDLEFVARNAAETVALLDAVRGSNQRAREHLDSAAALDAAPTQIAATMDAFAPAAEAMLALDSLDLAAARHHLAALPEPGTLEHQRHAAWFVVDLARAMVQTLEGDTDAALTTLENAVTAAGPRLVVPSFAHTVLVSAHARLLAVSGNPTRATNIVAHHSSLQDDAVLTATLALRAGRPVAAVEICTTALWRSSATPRERVAVLLVDMAARDALGDDAGARSSLRRAVQTSGPTLLQPYALTDRALLERVGTDVPEAAEVLELLRTAQVADHTTVDTPVVELSEREVAVLQELTSTASVEAVAKRLYVSTNTVKSQIRSLYRKLDVATRGAALAEGARMGFLSGHL